MKRVDAPFGFSLENAEVTPSLWDEETLDTEDEDWPDLFDEDEEEEETGGPI